MRKIILLSFFISIAFSFKCFANQDCKGFSCENLLQNLKEVTSKKDKKIFEVYFKEEIKMSQKSGDFSYSRINLDNNNSLIITRMKSIFSCNTRQGKQCLTKIIIQNNNGNYNTVFDNLYTDIEKDSIYLEKDNKSTMPFIKFSKYKYKYNPEIKYYELSSDSPIPETLEVIDPLTEPLNKEEILQIPFLDKFKKVFASISFISQLNAANCPTMVKPVIAVVSSPFGYRHLNKGKEFHAGVDYKVPIGTPLPAIADGKVIAVKTGCPRNVGSNLNGNCGGGLGNFIKLQLTNGDIVIYGHLDKVDVKVGQTVSTGTKIGDSGHSGRSSGAHLHFEIRAGGDSRSKAVEPVKYLESCGATKWNGSGASPSGSGTINNTNTNDGTGGSNNNRFQVENLPWYTGGDDTLSDKRYNELFKLEDTCEK